MLPPPVHYVTFYGLRKGHVDLWPHSRLNSRIPVRMLAFQDIKQITRKLNKSGNGPSISNYSTINLYDFTSVNFCDRERFLQSVGNLMEF
jgi:hypothetical protein